MNYPNYGVNMQQNINPYLSQQQQQMQRLAQMEQLQQQQYQMQQPQQMQQPSINIKQVTSIEETKVFTPDFSGAKMYFEDVINNKIYVKYMDLNGLPITKVYAIDNTPPKNVETINVDYVSKDEFNTLKAKMEQYECIINKFINGGSEIAK